MEPHAIGLTAFIVLICLIVVIGLTSSFSNDFWRILEALKKRSKKHLRQLIEEERLCVEHYRSQVIAFENQINIKRSDVYYLFTDEAFLLALKAISNSVDIEIDYYRSIKLTDKAGRNVTLHSGLFIAEGVAYDILKILSHDKKEELARRKEDDELERNYSELEEFGKPKNKRKK